MHTHTHIDSATVSKLTLKDTPLSVTEAMFLFWHTFDTMVKYCFSKSNKNGGLPTLFYCRTLEEAFDRQWHPHPTFYWKIPWTEESGRLQSMGPRVRHDWATSLSLFTFMHWRRKWQPTPVFLPGGSQGWGSLVGCRLWGLTESDTTEVT